MNDMTQRRSRTTREGWEIGAGEQVGPLCPDYGPDWAELCCSWCGATWVGVIDDGCPWCYAAAQRQWHYQRELTLTPPDLEDELNDRDWNHAISAWMERLDRAIAAGVITVHEASNAYQRATRGRHRGAA